MLVALMLVVTAMGVSYFISGTFGLKWHWIELGGLSPSTWSFNLEAFLTEMGPLVALISLLALASFALVSGAVKRYTRFVDSGVEYKQLLRSIKTIDDLEDEERLDQLKQHPELREFLLGFKNRMAAREKQLLERDKRGASPREAAPAGNMAAESAILVSAIMNGKAGFSKELALMIPELKQIERAAREQLTKESPAVQELENMRALLDSTVESFHGRANSLRNDADACVSGVRDMESLLVQLKQAAEAPRANTVATDGIAAAIGQMDAVAEALTGLGEQTRSIAIAAAMQASDTSPEGDSIRVADEVRAIATKFNTVAAQWKQAGPVLRKAIAAVEAGASSNADGAVLVAAATTAISKAQLWSERLVALQEQVRELDRSIASPDPVETPREWGTIDANFDDAGEDNFESNTAAVADAEAAPRAHVEVAQKLEVEPTMRASGPTAAPVAEVAPAPVAEPEMPEFAPADEAAAMGAEPTVDVSGADDSAEFETGSPENVFEIAAVEDSAQFTDIPGFEKEKRVFNERAEDNEVAINESAPIDVDQNAGSNLDASELAASAGSLTDDGPATSSGDASSGDDGFLTGPRAPEAPAPAAAPSRPAAAASPSVRTSPVATMEVEETADPDADAFDLYALGAVDYVEGVHA
ncbi:MAG TPA: hypothetical protein VFX92_01220 [Candidatus Krumholzibacteria bacterium]|nr:hypothetical protein [Candidatus Krumholzibacteria bacterium]